MGFNPLGMLLVVFGVACLYMGVFGTYSQVLTMLDIPGFRAGGEEKFYRGS